MKKRIAIYLAGNIKKGHETTHESFWTESDLDLIRNTLNQYAITFLNPAHRTDDLTDDLSVFGRDMLQVFSAHILFVDARERRGLGVGAEMMWAKLHQIPLVVWAPKNSHYRKDSASILGTEVRDYIHPFVSSMADKIVATPDEGATWIAKYLANPPSIKIKSIEDIGTAMQHYKATQLQEDVPMREICEIEDELTARMQRPLPQVVGTDPNFLVR